MEFTDAVVFDGKPRVTKDGYLVVDSRVARIGIQVYRGAEMGRPAMKTVQVWRPEEEVFSKDAMASLAYRPVTNDHPRHLVDATTWREVSVGMTGDTIARDGDYIRLPFTLMDADAIQDVNEGKRQLSLGYTAEIEWTSGETPDGHHYDAIQRSICGNHLAVVDSARAGPTCRIGDGFTSPAPTTVVKDNRNMAEPQLRTVMVDGLTISVTDQGAQAIDKLQRQIADMTTAAGRRDAEISAIRDANSAALTSAVQAKDGEIAGLRGVHTSAIEAKDGEIAGLQAAHKTALDALNGEIAALKAKQPDATAMDALIADRANVIDASRKILGDKYDPKGKSNAEIRRAAVEKRLGAPAVADKSDDYVGAAFDTLTAVGAVGTPGRDPVRDSLVRGSGSNPVINGVTARDADEAHAGMVSGLENAWKRPVRENV
jgi:hypothetical protein